MNIKKKVIYFYVFEEHFTTNLYLKMEFMKKIDKMT